MVCGRSRLPFAVALCLLSPRPAWETPGRTGARRCGQEVWLSRRTAASIQNTAWSPRVEVGPGGDTDIASGGQCELQKSFSAVSDTGVCVTSWPFIRRRRNFGNQRRLGTRFSNVQKHSSVDNLTDTFVSLPGSSRPRLHGLVFADPCSTACDRTLGSRDVGFS